MTLNNKFTRTFMVVGIVVLILLSVGIVSCPSGEDNTSTVTAIAAIGENCDAQYGCLSGGYCCTETSKCLSAPGWCMDWKFVLAIVLILFSIIIGLLVYFLVM